MRGPVSLEHEFFLEIQKSAGRQREADGSPTKWLYKDGKEVSSSFGDHEIHILGLFRGYRSPSLQAALNSRHHRDQRNQEMLGRLDAHGIHLTARR